MKNQPLECYINNAGHIVITDEISLLLNTVKRVEIMCFVFKRNNIAWSEFKKFKQSVTHKDIGLNLNGKIKKQRADAEIIGSNFRGFSAQKGAYVRFDCILTVSNSKGSQ